SLGHILRRQQLRPGIRTRPYTNNDAGFFGQDAKGLSQTGQLYETLKRLPDLERLKLIIRLGAGLPESPWQPLLAWVFTDGQVVNLAQDLSQRPVADHEPYLSRLAQQPKPISGVLDWNEVTKDAHHQQQPCPKNRRRRASR